MNSTLKSSVPLFTRTAILRFGFSMLFAAGLGRNAWARARKRFADVWESFPVVADDESRLVLYCHQATDLGHDIPFRIKIDGKSVGPVLQHYTFMVIEIAPGPHEMGVRDGELPTLMTIGPQERLQFSLRPGSTRFVEISNDLASFSKQFRIVFPEHDQALTDLPECWYIGHFKDGRSI